MTSPPERVIKAVTGRDISKEDFLKAGFEVLRVVYDQFVQAKDTESQAEYKRLVDEGLHHIAAFMVASEIKMFEHAGIHIAMTEKKDENGSTLVMTTSDAVH